MSTAVESLRLVQTMMEGRAQDAIYSWMSADLGYLDLRVVGTRYASFFASERLPRYIQGQLIVGDYFKEDEDAAEMSEEATELIGWINNHGRVRVIIQGVQQDVSGKVLSFITANLTRWTTHFVAYDRLITVQQPLRSAALMKRDAILEAQIGAQKNPKEVARLRNMANVNLDRIEDPTWWKRLSTVVDDLEPICYMTNICQSDHARPDTVLLAFAGVFLHFLHHENRILSAGMVKRLERRWTGFNQELLIATLVLNPFERLERFGPDAGANHFSIIALITEVCPCVYVCPTSYVFLWMHRFMAITFRALPTWPRLAMMPNTNWRIPGLHSKGNSRCL